MKMPTVVRKLPKKGTCGKKSKRLVEQKKFGEGKRTLKNPPMEPIR